MNEITYQKSYQEYKEELKTELNRTVESFVRIGYLLKVARDTDILKQSEYDNVVEGLQKIADAKAKEKFIASEKKFIKSLAED